MWGARFLARQRVYAATSTRNLSVRSIAASSFVLIAEPHDVNIVTERLKASGGPFDLVIATNVLVYYDRFEEKAPQLRIPGTMRSAPAADWATKSKGLVE